MSEELLEIVRRGERRSLARRIGQALWMNAGLDLERGSLLWARSLLGDGGDELLWQALLKAGVLTLERPEVQPRALASFLCEVFGVPNPGAPELVWSLPPGLPSANLRSYATAAEEVIGGAQRAVVLVSPFLEPRGVGKLLGACIHAVHRGVSLSLVTHTADDVASLAAVSLEELRREAKGMPGLLRVFSTPPDAGVLLHSKIVLADDAFLIVGSANITGRGLGDNLETGVLLTGRYIAEVLTVVNALIGSPLVTEVFRNRP